MQVELAKIDLLKLRRTNAQIGEATQFGEPSADSEQIITRD